MGELFNIILIQPTTNVLLFFHYIFSNIHLPFAFGFSIIALTAAVRLLLHPLFREQIKMTKKMEDIKPHMAKLNALHKEDKKKLQEEQMKLYKEHGLNPASGCVFALVQMPIFFSLYQVLSKFVTNGAHPDKIIAAINKLAYAPFLRVTQLDPYFFGINLWVTPSQYQKMGWWYLLIPVMTGILQYLQVQVSLPKKVVVDQKIVKKDVKKEAAPASSQDDMQKMMSTQMKFMFPLMIAWFSYTLPVGLSLYWNIFSLFSIVQYKFHKHTPIK